MKESLKISLLALYKSTFAWLIICLMLFDGFLISVRPLQYVQVHGLITADQEPLNDKLEYLYSAIHKPELLILGSSLPMHACFGADWEAAGKPQWLSNYIMRYTGSTYLDKLLSKKLQQPVTGYDLGMPACMISDDYAILKDALAKGIKPKMVLLTVAPRDFMDNMAQPVIGSRYYKFFAERKEGLKVSTNKTLAENTNEVLRYGWRFFRVRADYSRTIEFIVCSSLGRASSFFNAVNGKVYNRDMLKEIAQLSVKPYADPAPAEAAVIKADLSVYKKRYLPFDDKRLALELGYLQKILEKCKSENIIVSVVSMPVHPENLQLLGATQESKIFDSVAKVCAKNGTPFINMAASSNYTAADFSDSVHIRSGAAIKFFDELTAKLFADTQVSNQLSQQFSTNKNKVASQRETAL